MKNLKIAALIALLLAFSENFYAQVHDQKWTDIIDKSEPAWFSTVEAKQVAENVLLYQRNIGGWPKNIQMQNPLTEVEKQKLIELKPDTKEVTTDNGATCQEMLFLFKFQTKDIKMRFYRV